MSYVLQRLGSQSLPTAVNGEGCYLIDSGGRRYLDASGGAAVSCLGHSHPAPIAAIKRQLDTLPYAHTSFFTSDALEEAAAFLVTRAPRGMAKAYFVSGGSEANEAALKLARQYFVETGEPGRTHFIARRQSYHGNTLGALSVGGNAGRRALFEPLLVPASQIAPCYEYRGKQPGESAAAYAERVAHELEAAILRVGPGTVIAFIAETVAGATLGAVPPAPGYFRRIREICDRYGVLLVLDEVMCGTGRTGTLFACEQEGIVPDIVTIAKGLGAGYQPIGAMLVSAKLDEAIASGSGSFRHGHTYMGHATACAGALAVLQTIEREDLLAAVVARGDYLRQRLAERFAAHPHVGDLRGRGLFLGLELVADRDTKQPFEPAPSLHLAVKREAMARGLLCYCNGGTMDGTRGDHVLLAPPFILSEREADAIVDRLGAAVDAAIDGVALARGAGWQAS